MSTRSPLIKPGSEVCLLGSQGILATVHAAHIVECPGGVTAQHTVQWLDQQGRINTMGFIGRAVTANEEDYFTEEELSAIMDTEPPFRIGDKVRRRDQEFSRLVSVVMQRSTEIVEGIEPDSFIRQDFVRCDIPLEAQVNVIAFEPVPPIRRDDEEGGQ